MNNFNERKLRKMYVRQNQLSLIKYARKAHGEYVVSTTENCDPQYNRKCIHALVHTTLKCGWDVDSIRLIIDFLPLHCWNTRMVPPRYPQRVTLKFNSELVKSGECVLHADPKSYVSNRFSIGKKHLAGRQWIDEHGFVLTSNFLEIPSEFVSSDLEAIVTALITETGRAWSAGTFNDARFRTTQPNGNLRFYRQREGETFIPKESFGFCQFQNESSFSQCILVDVCA